MDQYNWASHYAADIRQTSVAAPFRWYAIENETGTGKVISCPVFPGVQTVYNDLLMQSCGKTVPRNDGIIEISYCTDGRYECEVSTQYCFYVSHGDLSFGAVGRREAGGCFPTKRYCGLTVFLDAAVFREQNDTVINETKIDLEGIMRAALQQPRRFILHGNPKTDSIFQTAADAQKRGDLSLLKLKILELFLFLGNVDFDSQKELPVYLNHTQAILAKNTRNILVSSLSAHLTLEQLSGELHASPTSIKRAFRVVYGASVREYMKSYRLDEAKRLLGEKKLPVAEVAALVGYQNPGHFTAAFKSKFGVLPCEYKKMCLF